MADPPDFVVLGIMDDMKWVTGNDKTSPQTLPPWLAEDLKKNFKPLAGYKHSELLRRE